ncbi:MAG: hypothetical protein LBW85_11765 [Deltaproteobacteria bacterium]|nr:hypothetical protein [Deltaproteobacteria bacterium]
MRNVIYKLFCLAAFFAALFGAGKLADVGVPASVAEVQPAAWDRSDGGRLYFSDAFAGDLEAQKLSWHYSHSSHSSHASHSSHYSHMSGY